MKINNITDSVAAVELTLDEIGVLNNALNEVCNGVDLGTEFDTRMGCTVQEARGLLAEISDLGRYMTVNSS